MSLVLVQVNQIEEKKQVISLTGWLRLMWDDENLKWDPSEFGNITEVRLDPNLIWTPDIHLYNKAAIDDGNLNTNGIHDSQYRAIVYSSGQVLFVPTVSLKASCPMHMTWFPFDSQTCTLKFGSWTYSQAQLDLKLFETEEWDPEDYVENGEWQLLSFTSQRKENYYPCCTEAYVNLDFKISLKRRPLYYFFNLIIPSALIGFLALLGFSLPPDSEAKLTLGVTLLFSLILFLNIISESMPTNLSSVPLLGVYFTCVMLIIAMSVVSTILVNLKLEKEVPHWVKLVCLKVLGPITGVEPPHSLDNMNGRRFSYNIDKPMVFNSSGENRIQVEWNYVALVVDRFCLMLSLGITTIAMIWAMVRSN